MLVMFRPYSVDTGSEVGTFLIDRDWCVKYLKRQVEEWAIRADLDLLEWIESDRAENLVPQKYDERMRFVAWRAVDDGIVDSVTCQICRQEVPGNQLVRKPWDDSIVDSGIRCGASGESIQCSDGHELMQVCDRVY